MKAMLFSLCMILFCEAAIAQSNFKWDKIDSVSKTKSQIYSDTKIFIAEKWNSAQSVIQNDDKENGVIIVKGVVELNPFFLMNSHTYRYSYTVKFLMKENRYKLSLDNVHCIYSVCRNVEWPFIEPCEEGKCPKYAETSVPEARVNEIMKELKKNLQGIVDSYEAYIKQPSSLNSDW